MARLPMEKIRHWALDMSACTLKYVLGANWITLGQIEKKNCYRLAKLKENMDAEMVAVPLARVKSVPEPVAVPVIA